MARTGSSRSGERHSAAFLAPVRSTIVMRFDISSTYMYSALGAKKQMKHVELCSSGTVKE
jgi:hypothetical protein